MPRPPRDEPHRERRPSTLVDRRRLPGVRAREELNRLLRIHDPEAAAESMARMTGEHAVLLRQIARETPLSHDDTVVRRHAIALLGRLASAEDVNLLSDLARFDPDSSVRGEALMALGRSGLVLAAPMLRDALASRDPVEAVTASKALKVLADKVGEAAVRSMIRTDLRGELAKRVEQALAAPARVRRRPRRVRSRRTRGD